ncbi:aminotransferase class IV [Chitinophaga sp. GCM10012297]|uniref:branched-chain-amino-acid transaminase n=1 Tax=Chitinophaga chungangae TaxID=2821488 RepID=A0ABS3YH11_9BACT|nr:aminotransferase class IV [Chitinophaga chungangae]MBO9153978.1 aminotransferase class IV family protein [Chitinophaga chungangae]
MSQLYAVINGQYVQEQDAKIRISDLSIQRGYGIFDYFRTKNHQPVFLDDHLDRFYRSADMMRLPVEPSRETLKQLIAGLTDRNGLAHSGIRITLTGGYSENGYTLSEPNLLITQSAYSFSGAAFDKGIRLVTYDYQRQLPQVKTIDYLQSIYLQPFINEHQADDVLYHDRGELRECPRANFFIVTANGVIVTPAEKILKGVTRKKILELENVNTKEGVVRLEDLQHAREAFITSTTKIVLPVLEIDGKIVGDGRPGEVTKSLYDKLVSLRGGIE